MGTSKDDLLTIEDAAERMAVSARQVRRLVAEKRIAHHRLGRLIRLRSCDVDDYIDAGRIEPVDVDQVVGEVG